MVTAGMDVMRQAALFAALQEQDRIEWSRLGAAAQDAALALERAGLARIDKSVAGRWVLEFVPEPGE